MFCYRIYEPFFLTRNKRAWIAYLLMSCHNINRHNRAWKRLWNVKDRNCGNYHSLLCIFQNFPLFQWGVTCVILLYTFYILLTCKHTRTHINMWDYTKFSLEGILLFSSRYYKFLLDTYCLFLIPLYYQYYLYSLFFTNNLLNFLHFLITDIIN